MILRHHRHKELEAVLCFRSAADWSKELLHQLEDGDDMPPLLRLFFCWRKVLGEEQDRRRQYTLGRLIKVRVLPIDAFVPGWIDDRIGKYLGILLGLCSGFQVIRVRNSKVHVAVDEREQIVAIAACGISQVNDRHLIAVILGRDRAVVACEVTLAVEGEEAHSAGAGKLQIGVQKVRRLSYAGGTDHQAMDVVAVHQRADQLRPIRILTVLSFLPYPFYIPHGGPPKGRNAPLFFLSSAHAADHDALFLRKTLSLAPMRHIEGDMSIGLADLFQRCPACRTVLAVADRFALDAVEGIVLGDDGHHQQEDKQSGAERDERHGVMTHVAFSFFSNLAHRSSFQSLRCGQRRWTSKFISSKVSVMRSQASLPASSLSRHRYTVSSLGFCRRRSSTGWAEVPQQAT